MNKINVLIIDNRPMVIEGIKSALIAEKVLERSFQIECSLCYNEAFEMILNQKNKCNSFDVIIVDVDSHLTDPGSLGFGDKKVTEFKKISEKSKIITIIRSKDNYRIYNILKKVKPDGFLLETELDINCLYDLVKTVLEESVYYSKSIFNILNKNQTSSLILDDIDREILYLLSKGVKTKHLTKYIARSLSALEKRKQRIKDILVMDNCTDQELIENAVNQDLV